MNNQLRIKCPQCQKVQDITGPTVCQCGFHLEPQAGTITLYRKGSPVGSAVGAGVYINDVPFGHIAVTEKVTFSLPFGSHKFHMTMGMTRRCKDIVVNISPETPNAYIMGALKMGFWSNTIIMTPTTPDVIMK